MKIRKAVTVFVALSLVASSLPAMAQTPAGATAPSQFKASVDHAIASAARETSSQAASRRSPMLAKEFRSESEEQSGGGGGGHAVLIVTLVATAASIAVGYYALKQIKKTTTPTPTPTQ
jgi:hypothetical protein